MIRNKEYLLKANTTINPEFLKQYISLFWKDIFSGVKSTNHLSLIVRVKYVDQLYKTIAPMRKVNLEDKELFTNFLLNRLGKLVDTYQTEEAILIVFSYIVLPGKASNHLVDLEEPIYKCESYSYNNYVLPITMKPEL